MLVVLFGVSCVGKSTIIERLIEHGYKPVRVYTTRQLREGEKIKIHVSNELFTQYYSQQRFAWVNSYFNVQYGTSQQDILNAQTDDSVYLLDYALKQSKDFDGIDCKKIIVIPESLEALTRQIELAQRHSRFSEIIQDYHLNYNDEVLKNYKQLGFKIITNYFSNPMLAINQIKSLIEEESLGVCVKQY